MKARNLITGSLFALAVVFGAQKANAQEGITSVYPPGYNPYLQMINPRGTVTQNYFSLVYPQLRIQDNFNQLQQQSIDTRRGIAKLQAPIVTTNKGVGFNTHLKYFDNNTSRFGVNNTTNTNIRPPITTESLLRAYKQKP